MTNELLLLSDLPEHITITAKDIFDDFYKATCKMTYPDYDIGELLGIILKAIEYPDRHYKELQYQIGVIFENMLASRLDVEFDNDQVYNDVNDTAHKDINILLDAVEELAKELDGIFDNRYMRGIDGRLNYYIDHIERENTILFKIRNVARKPKLLPSPSLFERRLLDIGK